MNLKKEIKKAEELLHLGTKYNKPLKKEQYNAIKDAIVRKDTLVIAPTAFGKSVIYQVTGLVRKGITVVIVPLLSLLHDQVDKLKELKINAGYYCSEPGSITKKEIIRTVDKDDYCFVYTTPESFLKLLDLDILIMTVVVDECHCETEWGYSFRENYLYIGPRINTMKYRPAIIATTATAPAKDRDVIKHLLSMEKAKVHEVPLYRKELTYVIKSVASNKKKESELKKLLKKHEDEPTVIYCITKDQTERVFEKVNQWYPDQAVVSHSKVKHRERQEKSFISGGKNIMVATSAFGMGIDKADIRLVIHYGLPLSPIEYAQQTGRAARDGKKAKCVMLYENKDYSFNQQFLEVSSCSSRAFDALDQMKEIVDSEECIVSQLLAYLGDTNVKPCGKCTYCQRRKRSHG